MEEIRKTVESILCEIDEDILEYDGDNLIEEGLIDSFAIVIFLARVEERLHIEIPPERVKEENFKSIGAIVELLKTQRECG